MEEMRKMRKMINSLRAPPPAGGTLSKDILPQATSLDGATSAEHFVAHQVPQQDVNPILTHGQWSTRDRSSW